jgi:hypothetical protein
MIYATWALWLGSALSYFWLRRDWVLVAWFCFALVYALLCLFPTALLDVYHYVVLRP